ncbi:toprim domain-containing protein [Faecalibaculum rodentium]|uniref:toprim domain-containing protein n=1 Tax=Faecalibaculum rodentium TaxID=1702221 RepID=UPI0023F504C3|nr:toprim domain-containing protein [Faecalibaculum rodentium]
MELRKEDEITEYHDFADILDDHEDLIREEVETCALWYLSDGQGGSKPFLSYDDAVYLGVNDLVDDQQEKLANLVSAAKERQRTAPVKKISYSAMAKYLEKKVDIFDLAEELCDGLIRNGKKTMVTQLHDSLVLKRRELVRTTQPDGTVKEKVAGNRFFWNSQIPTERQLDQARQKGWKAPKTKTGGVVSLYMELQDVDFRQAVKELWSQYGDDDLTPVTYENLAVRNGNRLNAKDRHKSLYDQLTSHKFQNHSMQGVIHYLADVRGIDREIIDQQILHKCLFETRDKFDQPLATFVARDKDGYISGVSVRGTFPGKKFMMDYPDCDYDIGWHYDPQFDPSCRYDDSQTHHDPDKKLLCFESYIEMMSYMTILKNEHRDYSRFAYLACGSTTKYGCIEETCKNYGYRDVVVMFNNDPEKDGKSAGRDYANLVKEQLTDKGINCQVLLPKSANDWNDTLMGLRNGTIKLHHKDVKKNRTEPAGGKER